MSENERQLRQTLAKIAKLAGGALNGNGGLEEEDSDYEPGQSGGKAAGVCTPKTLPRRLLVKAAETAVKINPVNAPAFGPLAEVAADLVLDPQRIAVLTAKYWGPTPRKLTVSFMESTPTDLKKRILLHMNAWGKTACITFALTQSGGNVRISRGQGGYYSYLGTDILHIPSNRQTMNLEAFTMNTPEREFHRVVRHETGHTLGFPHEHMRRELVARIDPEKAYDYFLRTQGWDRNTVDQQVLTPLDERTILGTPPDQTSIMCYQLPGSITRDGRPIIGGLDVNQTDFAFAGRIYPKPGRDVSAEMDEEYHSEEWEDEEATV